MRALQTQSSPTPRGASRKNKQQTVVFGNRPSNLDRRRMSTHSYFRNPFLNPRFFGLGEGAGAGAGASDAADASRA